MKLTNKVTFARRYLPFERLLLLILLNSLSFIFIANNKNPGEVHRTVKSKLFVKKLELILKVNRLNITKGQRTSKTHSLRSTFFHLSYVSVAVNLGLKGNELLLLIVKAIAHNQKGQHQPEGRSSHERYRSTTELTNPCGHRLFPFFY